MNVTVNIDFKELEDMKLKIERAGRLLHEATMLLREVSSSTVNAEYEIKKEQQ